ncbi:hypothetical protein QF042_004450 [Pedobacter sp. W3I1]|nr:hypothetical protein [Pedobacter sp. W3I1]
MIYSNLPLKALKKLVLFVQYYISTMALGDANLQLQERTKVIAYDYI